MKKHLIAMAIGLLAFNAHAQKGAITSEMWNIIRSTNPTTPETRALRNALNTNDIKELALNAENPDAYDFHFSNKVASAGITDQESSGRCWLFSGLNVMRSAVIRKYNLDKFEFSQSYCFFFDQLEKSNLFLQSIIDNAKEPLDSRQNTWLMQHPLSDGGTFAGVQEAVMKYGLVPAEIFPESYNVNHTSKMAQLIKLKLRQYALELRQMVADGKSQKAINKRKTEQLAYVYHVLKICLGTPPETFTYTLRDKEGKEISTKTYTPQSFYKEVSGKDLRTEYVMLMNDPTRPFYKLYAVDLDRHTYDGPNWTYINLPMKEIKEIAVKSIRENVMMYMSCDVGKYLNAKTGVLSLKNYDYEDLLSTTFPMTKAERIKTYASASSHAMTLMAVDIDKEGKTKKWMVENSWGPSHGHNGHLVMTEEWLDEYLFRLVAEKRFVNAKLLDILKQEPTLLPAWDPLFQSER